MLPRLLLLTAALLSFGLPAMAQTGTSSITSPDAPTACTIEGLILAGKQKVTSKDCFENIGAEPDDFQRVCHAMEQTALAVTRASEMPPPKITLGKRCEAGAQARCKGFLHMPILNYHYQRSPHELEIARESCLTQGGEWQEKP